MVARGRVKNGVVVLAGDLRLAEGQEVTILIAPTNTSVYAQGDLIAFLRRWRTEYPEPDETLAHDIDASRSAVQPPHDPWE